MNKNSRQIMARAFTVLAAAILTACGGGGGGGAAPAAVTVGSASAITSEVIDIGFGAVAFGAAGGTLLRPLSAGSRPTAQGVNRTLRHTLSTLIADQRRRALASFGPVSFPCDAAGTVQLSGSAADPEILTAGDVINVTFADCDFGSGDVTDGAMRIVVTSYVEGVGLGTPYRLKARVTLNQLAITADNRTAAADGTVNVEFDTLTDPTRLESTMDGALLTISAGAEQWRLRNFVVSEAIVGADLINGLIVETTASGTLEGSGFDGAVEFMTVEPFVKGSVDEFPSSGQIVIDGAKGSSLVATVIDDTSIGLSIDADGDGTPEANQVILWTSIGPQSAGLFGGEFRRSLGTTIPTPLCCLIAPGGP